MPKELRALSASLIKCWETCSWLYYVKYNLRLPDVSNAGALRGTICHKIFEILQAPRHREHFDAIIEEGSLEGSPAVERLVHKLLNKSGINEDEHRDMVYDMILVGLQHDFFIEDAVKVEKPEFRFDVTDDKGRFRIKGFIDLLAFYQNGALIRDYKSSKAKFGKGELNPNLQNLIYSWFVYQQFKVLAKTQFLFLRFPKQPVQEPTQCTHEDLIGAEEYFAYVSSQIQNFDEKKAQKNFASRSKETKWLCGSDQPGKWCCAYRKPFDYYVVVDADGVEKRTAFKQSDLSPKEGEKVEKRHYKGCPRYN